MTDFTFDDRISWLAFRADWRTRYKVLSADIRSIRREIGVHRAERRRLGTAGVQHQYAADGMQSGLWYKSREANRMMRELDAAKERKAEQLAERDAERPIAA